MGIKAVFFDFGGTPAETPPDFDYETCIKSLHQNFLTNGFHVSYEDCKRAYAETSSKYFGQDPLREVDLVKVITEALGQCGYHLSPSDKVMDEAAAAYMEPFVQAKTVDRWAPHVSSESKAKVQAGCCIKFLLCASRVENSSKI